MRRQIDGKRIARTNDMTLLQAKRSVDKNLDVLEGSPFAARAHEVGTGPGYTMCCLL